MDGVYCCVHPGDQSSQRELVRNATSTDRVSEEQPVTKWRAMLQYRISKSSASYFTAPRAEERPEIAVGWISVNPR